jgi:hypothetical protein
MKTTTAHAGSLHKNDDIFGTVSCEFTAVPYTTTVL